MKKTNYLLLTLLFCIPFLSIAQNGFQQNGNNLYYNDGFLGLGTSEPSARLTVKHGDLHVIQTPLNEYQPSKTEISLWNIGVGNKPHKWCIFTSSTAGYYGLSSNSFEICEYPANTNPNIMTSLRRMVFESSRDVQSNPIVIGARGSLNVGFLPGLVPEDKNDLSVNGNVGIGTLDTQGYKLAVNGIIRAKEIKVDSEWADFVFEDNYRLPSLDEVSIHIKEKRHLPGIPTADEVSKNGVNLGEMNTILLQKIEELTLYMIELKQENREIKQQLNHLQNKQ